MNLLEFYETKNEYALVFEHVPGLDMLKQLKLVKKFTEKAALRIVEEILQAVKYLHSQGLVHRGLCLESISSV